MVDTAEPAQYDDRELSPSENGTVTQNDEATTFDREESTNGEDNDELSKCLVETVPEDTKADDEADENGKEQEEEEEEENDEDDDDEQQRHYELDEGSEMPPTLRSARKRRKIGASKSLSTAKRTKLNITTDEPAATAAAAEADATFDEDEDQSSKITLHISESDDHVESIQDEKTEGKNSPEQIGAQDEDAEIAPTKPVAAIEAEADVEAEHDESAAEELLAESSVIEDHADEVDDDSAVDITQTDESEINDHQDAHDSKEDHSKRQEEAVTLLESSKQTVENEHFAVAEEEEEQGEGEEDETEKPSDDAENEALPADIVEAENNDKLTALEPEKMVESDCQEQPTEQTPEEKALHSEQVETMKVTERLDNAAAAEIVDIVKAVDAKDAENQNDDSLGEDDNQESINADENKDATMKSIENGESCAQPETSDSAVSLSEDENAEACQKPENTKETENVEPDKDDNDFEDGEVRSPLTNQYVISSDSEDNNKNSSSSSSSNSSDSSDNDDDEVVYVGTNKKDVVVRPQSRATSTKSTNSTTTNRSINFNEQIFVVDDDDDDVVMEDEKQPETASKSPSNEKSDEVSEEARPPSSLGSPGTPGTPRSPVSIADDTAGGDSDGNVSDVVAIQDKVKESTTESGSEKESLEQSAKEICEKPSTETICEDNTTEVANKETETLEVARKEETDNELDKPGIQTNGDKLAVESENIEAPVEPAVSNNSMESAEVAERNAETANSAKDISSEVIDLERDDCGKAADDGKLEDTSDDVAKATAEEENEEDSSILSSSDNTATACDTFVEPVKEDGVDKTADSSNRSLSNGEEENADIAATAENEKTPSVVDTNVETSESKSPNTTSEIVVQLVEFKTSKIADLLTEANVTAKADADCEIIDIDDGSPIKKRTRMSSDNDSTGGYDDSGSGTGSSCSDNSGSSTPAKEDGKRRGSEVGGDENLPSPKKLKLDESVEEIVIDDNSNDGVGAPIAKKAEKPKITARPIESLMAPGFNGIRKPKDLPDVDVTTLANSRTYPAPKDIEFTPSFRLEFQRKYRKTLNKMTRSDLESLIMAKIAETIMYRSEFGEVREKLQKQDKMLYQFQLKIASQSKIIADLETMHARTMEALKAHNGKYCAPVKINRSVAVQAGATMMEYATAAYGDDRPKQSPKPPVMSSTTQQSVVPGKLPLQQKPSNTQNQRPPSLQLLPQQRLVPVQQRQPQQQQQHRLQFSPVVAQRQDSNVQLAQQQQKPHAVILKKTITVSSSGVQNAMKFSLKTTQAASAGTELQNQLRRVPPQTVIHNRGSSLIVNGSVKFNQNITTIHRQRAPSVSVGLVNNRLNANPNTSAGNSALVNKILQRLPGQQNSSSLNSVTMQQKSSRIQNGSQILNIAARRPSVLASPQKTNGNLAAAGSAPSATEPRGRNVIDLTEESGIKKIAAVKRAYQLVQQQQNKLMMQAAQSSSAALLQQQAQLKSSQQAQLRQAQKQSASETLHKLAQQTFGQPKSQLQQQQQQQQRAAMSKLPLSTTAHPINNAISTSKIRPGNMPTKQTTTGPGPASKTGNTSAVVKAVTTAKLMAPPEQGLSDVRRLPPLPSVGNQDSKPNWKKLPPRPYITKVNLTDGVILAWTILESTEECEAITGYQIFAYQEPAEPSAKAELSSSQWQLVGDVHAMNLPMAVTLNKFPDDLRYHFAVRIVDQYKRVGPFSVPKTW